MALGQFEEFTRVAVHIALTGGLARRQASADLGVGKSALNKWVKTYRDTDVVFEEDQKLLRENECLHKENRLLREEREVLERAAIFFAGEQ